MGGYPVQLHIEGESVWVTCRDLPAFHSAGESEAEALRESVDGLETALSIYVDRRHPIPAPSAPQSGEYLVHLPVLTVAKVALWNAMIAQDVSKTELARRLGVHMPQVDRLVDILHNSKIDQLENALKALGKRLQVTVQDVQLGTADLS